MILSYANSYEITTQIVIPELHILSYLLS